MRSIVLFLTIFSFFLWLPPSLKAEEKSAELFLARILSIDAVKNKMALEIVDLNSNSAKAGETFIYNFESSNETSKQIISSIKQGDLIRIWGNIDRSHSLEGITLIKGKIYPSSNRSQGGSYDPTGVRKRIKRGLNPRSPLRGSGSGGGK
ncbi:MAG: hypothetical protein HQK64_01130 [Desulfamplus sp.]|nr:hypothetical protein [Desulfamplus sp.]